MMSKRSQESCSPDSPTVKGRSSSFNLVCHQSLSMRQNSQMTTNPTISGSTRIEDVSTCIGTPLPENTSRDSVWDSQERSQGDKVKIDPEHPERGRSTCSRETTAIKVGFSGQTSSVHSGSMCDKPASGKPMLVDLECFRKRLGQTCRWETSACDTTNDHGERAHAKSFPKCEKQIRT